MRLRISFDDGRGGDARRWKRLAAQHLQRAMMLYIVLSQVHDAMSLTDQVFEPSVCRARKLLDANDFADIAALAEQADGIPDV